MRPVYRQTVWIERVSLNEVIETGNTGWFSKSSESSLHKFKRCDMIRDKTGKIVTEILQEIYNSKQKDLDMDFYTVDNLILNNQLKI